VPYEVIKRVGRRSYRYRVESIRDDASGTHRKRWTYLGVAPSSAPPEPATRRPGASDSRERLLDAFERLAAREAYGAITASAISAEAGLAHGTFYRHFRDKRAIFDSAVERVREEIVAITPSFSPPYGTLAEERGRVRRRIASALAKPSHHPGVMRAYFTELDGDATLRAVRDVRRTERIARLAAYFDALGAAATISALRSVAVATALSVMVEGAIRDAVNTRAPVAASVTEGMLDLVDRAIFESGTDGPSIAAAISIASSGSAATETRAPES